MTPGEPVGSNTTYLTVVDKDGNIASWIQSVLGYFGSRVTVEGMGFELQNRGAGFNLDPEHPNVLAGGKRPFHTIIPAFLEKGDRTHRLRHYGGAVQPLAHAQFVSNYVDFGMNPLQEAMEAPRFARNNADGCDVSIDFRVPGTTLQQLWEQRHIIRISANMWKRWAAARPSSITDNETDYAASDPRIADGSAITAPIVP